MAEHKVVLNSLYRRTTYGALCDVFLCVRVVREGLEHEEAAVRADSLRLLLDVVDQVSSPDSERSRSSYTLLSDRTHAVTADICSMSPYR